MSLSVDTKTHPGFAVFLLAPLAFPDADALEASSFGPFSLRQGDNSELASDQPLPDDSALLISVGSDEWALSAATQAATRTAVLIVADDPVEPERLLHLLELGFQDVLTRAEFNDPSLGRRLRAAIERKRVERQGRKSYATDLDTGLPHQQQLMEHMSHLLALREREPSPMAVLVLRVEGLATVEARLGREAANALRRKAGVRLRAGVRASDVVASLGDDSFAVLLGAMLLPADAGRVGAKLLSALLQPFKVAGGEVALAVALGVAQYPEDGAQPDPLLRRAIGLAASALAQGRLGHANFDELGSQPAGAANDD